MSVITWLLLTTAASRFHKTLTLKFYFVLGLLPQPPKMRFSSYNSNTPFSFLESAQISCKNLLAAGHTSSGTYYLKVNGYSFQVSSLAFYLLKESLEMIAEVGWEKYIKIYVSRLTSVT